MSILELINSKTKYEKYMVNILRIYCVKYLKKKFTAIHDMPSSLRKSKNIYKEFQLNLLKIAEWDNQKQYKEYKKFIKWCAHKKDLDEEILNNLLNNYIILTIKIITYNIDSTEILNNFNYPRFNKIFYKSLKNIARWFYENPKKVEDFDNDNIKFKKIITNSLQNLLPLEQVFEIVLQKDEKPLFIEYNYDNLHESKTDEEIDNQILENFNALVIEKESNPEDHIETLLDSDLNQLNYVDSEEFDNDMYYESSYYSENNNLDNDLKHIDLPVKNNKFN